MQIDSRIISIPPYISVSWDQVILLQTESIDDELVLILQLKEGKQIRIPDLGKKIVSHIFEQHKNFLINNQKKRNDAKSPLTFLQQMTGLNLDQLENMPIRFGISEVGREGIDLAMQHRADKADSPDLPLEMIEKISGITKMFTGGDFSEFPKPEAHCNCPFCQIARSIHGIEKTDATVEETVYEEDLQFRDWDIEQVGEKLYRLTNPLDPQESYNVYLGSPVGCTCGKQHCEHIKKVLSS